MPHLHDSDATSFLRVNDVPYEEPEDDDPFVDPFEYVAHLEEEQGYPLNSPR